MINTKNKKEYSNIVFSVVFTSIFESSFLGVKWTRVGKMNGGGNMNTLGVNINYAFTDS